MLFARPHLCLIAPAHTSFEGLVFQWHRSGCASKSKDETMTKQLIVIAALASCAAGMAQAQTSPWTVRARAVHLDMSNKDSTGLGLTVNNRTIPEVDVGYFFSPNLAAELALTVPQKQMVSSNGTDIGTFRHLPASLMMQYHFTGPSGMKPYVGAGVNYTHIGSVNILSGAGALDSHSWGAALQVGVDFPIDRNWSFNLDLRKIYLKTDVYASGANAGTLKLNPVMAGIGLGYRF
jgi:outer membrane protein